MRLALHYITTGAHSLTYYPVGSGMLSALIFGQIGILDDSGV